ncbi:MAG: 6-carboxytetrahydropterin synthase QueD [Bacteroidales bacterium]|jgi:6-pyruvoyltetrahydropterin/6-carboxytetrahydropterin synthase|nr:6-carboxytetrahydropterin synthase QueD [Bacteroidales bacterium]
MIFITKTFTFEAAHALKDYNGACANIHGHSYKLEVAVTGLSIGEDGMIIDFKDLKALVKKNILDEFDHSLMLNASTSSEVICTLQKQYNKVLVLPFQPTSENLIKHFAALIESVLIPPLSLKRLILYETATSYVTYEE